MEFDFEICHTPGKANSHTDALSRHPDYNQGTRDNEGVIVLPNHVFVKATTVGSEEAMPFETVTINFITKLPLSQGFDSILTVTNHDCTKAAIFIPCIEEFNAESTAALSVQHVFTHFRLPSKIISNRDLWFVSKFTCEICKLVGIEQNILMVYHPKTDRCHI